MDDATLEFVATTKDAREVPSVCGPCMLAMLEEAIGNIGMSEPDRNVISIVDQAKNLWKTLFDMGVIREDVDYMEAGLGEIESALTRAREVGYA
jgi:hypothetical protein